MAKVTVDATKCVGCGLCEQMCADVFKVDGDGIAKVKAQECKSCNLKDIAEQCPVQAIIVA